MELNGRRHLELGVDAVRRGMRRREYMLAVLLQVVGARVRPEPKVSTVEVQSLQYRMCWYAMDVC